MNEIRNQAEIDYQYRINPTGPDLSNTIESNETEVDLVLGELRMIKSVDKNYATIGDVLTYTIIINSTSEPSFDPNVGFIIPDINPNETVTITFEVTVN